MPSCRRTRSVRQHGRNLWLQLPTTGRALLLPLVDSRRDTAQTWHMLVADDFLLEAGGPEYRSALMAFFVLCAVSGAPLSWNKTAGGDTVSWVGFELLLRSHKLGISQRRAEWFTRWTREVAQAGHVNISTFEEGLGRVMYVAGALEYERPFLAPLYKFMSLHPRGSVRKVPAYVSFFLAHLSRQIEENRHYSCATEQRSSAVSPRVDAQASESRTGLGGWLPVLDENGAPDPWRSPWFSIEVTQEEWPWVYEKGGRPALIISTLEALPSSSPSDSFSAAQPPSTVQRSWLPQPGPTTGATDPH